MLSAKFSYTIPQPIPALFVVELIIISFITLLITTAGSFISAALVVCRIII